jgi:hypothetical protein
MGGPLRTPNVAKPKKGERTSLAEVRATTRSLGFTLSVRDREYRLAPVAGPAAKREAAAYYTRDLDDALGAAQIEARRRTVR